METNRRNFLKVSSLSLSGIGILPLNKLVLRDRCSNQYCQVASEFKPVEDIIENLKKMESIFHGFPVSQLEHGLQAATLARRSGESNEFIVACLCHDMGKVLSAFNHEEIAAQMLRPYLNDTHFNMIKYHGIFQGRFFWDKIGRDSESYKKFKGRDWYDLTMKFTEVYDAPAFKANFDTDSLESFFPELREVIGEQR